jgi:hypothetical protein
MGDRCDICRNEGTGRTPIICVHRFVFAMTTLRKVMMWDLSCVKALVLIV